MALWKGLGANLLVLPTPVGGVCSPRSARSTWSGRGMAGFRPPGSPCPPLLSFGGQSRAQQLPAPIPGAWGRQSCSLSIPPPPRLFLPEDRVLTGVPQSRAGVSLAAAWLRGAEVGALRAVPDKGGEEDDGEELEEEAQPGEVQPCSSALSHAAELTRTQKATCKPRLRGQVLPRKAQENEGKKQPVAAGRAGFPWGWEAAAEPFFCFAFLWWSCLSCSEKEEEEEGADK